MHLIQGLHTSRSIVSIFFLQIPVFPADQLALFIMSSTFLASSYSLAFTSRFKGFSSLSLNFNSLQLLHMTLNWCKWLWYNRKLDQLTFQWHIMKYMQKHRKSYIADEMLSTWYIIYYHEFQVCTLYVQLYIVIYCYIFSVTWYCYIFSVTNCYIFSVTYCNIMYQTISHTDFTV